MGFIQKIFHNKTALFLFFLSLIFIFPIFGGFYLSHDSITHLARAAFYEEAILDGQFPPRWAADANYGYGSPFFIFYYPFSGYIIALFHLVGFSFENSYLLVSFSAFLIGVLFFYLWIKRIYGIKAAFLSTLFYIALPYKYLTLFVRGGVGEFISFSLVPAIFFFIETKLNFSTRVLSSALIYSFIMLSHNAIALIFTPVFLFYSLIRGRNAFLNAILSVVFGLLLSAYFWIPSIAESGYTAFSKYFATMYMEHFPSIIRLIHSPVGFGPDVNKSGGLAPAIGIPAFAVVIGAVIVLFKQRKEAKIVVFWIILFCIGLFLCTSYSSFLWDKSAFLQKFQFPWRFVVIPSFAACALVAYIASKTNRIWPILIFVTGSVLYGLLFVKVEKHIKNPDSYYYDYPGSTYFHNEATTIWSAGDPSKAAVHQIEFAQGDGFISNVVKRTEKHTFNVKTDTQSVIVDNTVYFPGWKVYVNGRQTPIQFQDAHYRGIITFPVSSGENRVEVVFTETKIRLISDLISVIAWIFLFLAVILKLRKVNWKKRSIIF